MDPALRKPVFYCIVQNWRIMNQLGSEVKKTCLTIKATIKTEDKQSPQCITNRRIEKKCAWASL